MKITIKNFQNQIPIRANKIKQTALKVLSLEGIKKPGQINFCFLNDKQIRLYNLRYLGRDEPTDVLSFNLSDFSKLKKNILADIVISTETAVTNSKIFKTTPRYELCLYIVHGLLHLLGYDDETKKERKIMQQKSNHILNILKIQ